MDINALYTRQADGREPVPRGHLPTKRRKGAPEEENKARRRMHLLLNPKYVANAEELQVLEANEIPLQLRVPGRPEMGYHINPLAPLHSEKTSASAKADGAFEMAKLYLLQDDGRLPVLPGHLPTSMRKGAPDEENKARMRMHKLRDPKNLASAEELQVLRANGIPLQLRVPGRPEKGYHIYPLAPLQSEETSASAKADGAFEMAKLYLPQDDGRPPVLPGHLPTSMRKGAPDEENKARMRMHSLLDPKILASAAELQVLRANGIPLKERVPGHPQEGYHINPKVPRHSEETSASAKADGAFEMAKLYLPQDDGRPPVPYGHLPASIRREGAPDEENEARERMHKLLKQKYVASAEEIQVLSAKGIPFKERVPGHPQMGYRIDPQVPLHPENPASSYSSRGPEGYPLQWSGSHSSALPPGTEGMPDAASAVASSYSASSSAWDSGHYGGYDYSANTTQASLYLPSSYGYLHAESSFEAEPASGTGTSAHDQPSKRGRRR